MAKKTENKEQFEVQELTPEEQTEKRLGQLELMMSELSPGYRLSVYRSRPSWARSWLETIELTEDEPIDLNYLANEWGGEVLKLRILDERGKFIRGCDVPLMSYPPKVHGQLLRKPNQTDALPAAQNTAIVPAAQTPQRQNDLSTVIDLLQRTRKDDLSVLKSLLPYAGAEKQKPLSELIELAGQLGQLKDLFGANESSPPITVSPAADSDTIFLQSIAEMVKTVFAKQAPQAPQAARIVPPQNATTTTAIAARLASMSPDEAQKTFFAALTNMGPARAQETVEKILAGFNLQSTIEEDNDDDYDDDDDEKTAQSGDKEV